MEIGDKVNITGMIRGDDTPIVTTGIIISDDKNGTIIVQLDGKWTDSNMYYTDGSNIEVVTQQESQKREENQKGNKMYSNKSCFIDFETCKKCKFLKRSKKNIFFLTFAIIKKGEWYCSKTSVFK